MSATSSDSEEHSFSEVDSEFDFLGRYSPIEVENASICSSTEFNSESTSVCTSEEPTTVEPYSSEPIADEEWIKEYKLRQKEKGSRLNGLKDRLSGREALQTW